MTLAYATHRLSGVASPANAAYSAAELEFQLKNSGAKALFTVCQFEICAGFSLMLPVRSPSGNCSKGREIFWNPK
jgi:hypothetical protein